MKDHPFHICLTMAGAVSAGAYTGGVIDYLLETLEIWEQAKAKNRAIKKAHPEDYLEHGYDPGIPMHDVQIQVLSGASAGGITGTLTLAALIEGMEAVNHKNPKGRNNLLYDSWVNMADGKDGDTMSKLLATQDLDEVDYIPSLLNTAPIDEIADKALKLENRPSFPPYIAPDLDLILTVSNLRGVRYLINFEGSNHASGTTITNHSGFFRYRVKNDSLKPGIPDSNELYYVLDLDKADENRDLDFLKRATLSTAAFPIGLKARFNSIPNEYIHRYSRYLFGRESGVSIPDIGKGEGDFQFDSVDGGLINNEPFGWALSVLREKCPELEKEDHYAMIMIDPFPNFEEEVAEYESQTDILSVIPRMFKALRNQVMFKQDELLKAIDMKDRTRFLIAPTKKGVMTDKRGLRVYKKKEGPLACGALAGFSGFLDRSFRDHDFRLGRQNCQSFLRYYFALRESDLEQKLNDFPTEEALDRFRFSNPPKTTRSQGGEYFFPIIPDLRVIRAFDNQYDTENYGPDASLIYPDTPSIHIQELEKRYKKPAIQRIKAISRKLIKHWFLQPMISLFGGHRRAYKYLFKEIENGLRKQGLLKE
jgi:predicted acylesterase/phospholipase RssA